MWIVILIVLGALAWFAWQIILLVMWTMILITGLVCGTTFVIVLGITQSPELASASSMIAFVCLILYVASEGNKGPDRITGMSDGFLRPTRLKKKDDIW